MNGRKLYRLGAFVLGLLVFIGVYTPTVRAAASITTMPKLTIMEKSPNYTIGEKYVFVPQFNKDRSKLIVSGGRGKWLDLPYAKDKTVPGYNRQFKSLDLGVYGKSRGSAGGYKDGDIVARYTNVGTYKGKSVDLRIIIHDWQRIKLNDGGVNYLSFQKDKIAVTVPQNEWTSMTWEFVESGTTKRIRVAGYFTFADIDAGQAVQFNKATSKAIDRFIISDSGNYLKYRNVDGQYRIYDTAYVDYDDTKYNPRAGFSILYDRDHLRFQWRWTRDPSLTHLHSATKGQAGGQYFFYVMNKPTGTAIGAPVKSVDKETLTTNSNINYKIKHTVPYETSKYYYSSYVIEDTLDSALTNPTVSVYDGAGKNRTSWFNVSISDRTVKVSAKSDSLKSSSFYGRDYEVRISAGVNPTTLRTKIGSNNYYDIPNTAEVTVKRGSRSQTETSNKVTTRVPKPSAFETPTKTVTTYHGAQSSENSVIPSQSFVYDISHRVPKENPLFYFKNYRIEDTVDNALHVSHVEIFDASNNNVSNKFDIAVVNNKVTATAKESELSEASFYDTTYRMQLVVRLDESIDYTTRADANGRFTIKNKATVVKDGSSKSTDVTVSSVFLPNVELGLDKLEIYTDTASRGLPTDLTLSTATSQKQSFVKIVSSDVSVREGAGTSHASLGTLNRNNEITLYRLLDTAPNGWYQIDSPYGVGWVSNHASHTEVYEQPTQPEYIEVVSTSLPVRATPSASAKQWTTLTRNDDRVVYEVLAVADNGWYLIETDSGAGWVTYKSIHTKKVTPSHKLLDIVTNGELSVRAGPGTSHALLGHLRDRHTKRYYEVLKTDTSTGWHLIKTIHGTGWVSNKTALTRTINKDDVGLAFADEPLTINIREQPSDSVVASATSTIGEIVANNGVVTLNISPSGLSKGDVRTYRAEVTGYNEGLIQFEHGVTSIESKGYVAEEKVLNNTTKTFTGVVKTTRERNGRNFSPIQEVTEEVTIDFTNKQRTKSGYAFNPAADLSVCYENSLTPYLLDRFSVAGFIDRLTVVVDADAPLVEDSLTYYVNDRDKITVPTSRSMSESDTICLAHYKGPNTYISRDVDDKERFGKLLNVTASQQPTQGEALHQTLLVPVWLDSLGEYNLKITSTNPIGSHRTRINVNSVVDVYAYMFSHIDSDTIDDDELLIHPVVGRDLPDIWQ